MKRLFLLSAASVFAAATLLAVPAKPGPRTITQPDGTTITVYAHGDEFFHWLSDSEDNLIEQQADGFYVSKGKVTDEFVRSHVAANPKARKTAQKRHLPSATEQAIPLDMAPHGLIILVSFADESFETQIAEIDSMISGLNYTRTYSYSYYGSTTSVTAVGSARKYFIDQSMGQYQPSFDVVGPYTLPQNMAYYGGNDKNGDDKKPEQMIVDACELANADVDFSIYDNNNDGDIDFVYVIYAGYGEADSNIKNTVWPHAYWVYDGAGVTKMLDGKRLNSYACSNEINYTSKNNNGIGTFCHEFSHVLGLPDLYDTKNSGHRTLDDWDILDAGSYNDNGDNPPAYSSYERFFCGWLTPTILNQPGSYSLEDLKTSNTAFIITKTGASNLIGNDPNPTEFFLLENRQKTSWDKPLAGSGMMITKVKYNYDNWYNNTVNNTASNMGVDMIEAGGTGDYSNKKDLFPNGAKSYMPYSNYPITNITSTSRIIYFDFMGGSSALENTEAENTLNKRIIDGTLYIQHNGTWYDVLGRPCKQ